MGKEYIFKMWGTNEFGWIDRGAVNNAGGMIMMWRRRCLQVTNAFVGEKFCIIQGRRLRLLLRIFTVMGRLERRELFRRRSRKQEGHKYLRLSAWSVISILLGG